MDQQYLKTALDFVKLTVGAAETDIASEDWESAARKLDKALKHLNNARRAINLPNNGRLT